MRRYVLAAIGLLLITAFASLVLPWALAPG